jgi:hypothetical protein
MPLAVSINGDSKGNMVRPIYTAQPNTLEPAVGSHDASGVAVAAAVSWPLVH